MKLTALDIRQKTFEKSFRGIDRDEVQAFLSLVSQQWERQGDENRELRLKLEHAQQDVQKMREVESSLYRTLKTAEDTGQSIAEQAQRDADLRVREAQFQASQLLSEARQAARKVVDDAYQQAERTVADMRHEVATQAQECQRLESQLDGFVRDLHHLAIEALERAQKAQVRPKAGAAAILSRAASVQVERPQPPAAPEPENAMLALSASPTLAPAAYNPKPGQQPDPYAPTTPSPDIERPGAPLENPGISPAPRIDQPAPSQVPSPGGPRVEPMAPDIQPIGPDRPEITQPSPMTHPGMAAPAAGGGSSFNKI